MTNLKKYPPYGKQVVESPPPRGSTINICTGSGGFTRAKESNSGIISWIDGVKIALPFGGDPEQYKWPISGHIAAIWVFGEPERQPIIDRLAVCCLRYGAIRVMYLHGDGMQRWAVQVKEVAA